MQWISKIIRFFTNGIDHIPRIFTHEADICESRSIPLSSVEFCSTAAMLIAT